MALCYCAYTVPLISKWIFHRTFQTDAEYKLTNIDLTKRTSSMSGLVMRAIRIPSTEIRQKSSKIFVYYFGRQPFIATLGTVIKQRGGVYVHVLELYF